MFFVTILLDVYFIPILECFPNNAESFKLKQPQRKFSVSNPTVILLAHQILAFDWGKK